jgi:uncharacterized protein YkwD
VNTRRWVVLLVALTLVGGLACVAVARMQERQPTPEEIAYEIVVLVNDERRALGVEPLVINDHLTLMAQWRSQDMIDGEYYSHDPPPGHPTLGDMCEQLGYQWVNAPVENLVFLASVDEEHLDLTIADQAVVAWKGSPGHWQWAISPETKVTGVGIVIADGGAIATQLFWGEGGFTPSEARQFNREAP